MSQHWVLGIKMEKKKKHKTFADSYPKGTCFLCKKPCEPKGIMHQSCAYVYTMERIGKAKG